MITHVANNSQQLTNKISVIVTTQDRFLELSSMLYSVNEQLSTPVECIVGIQDSSVVVEDLISHFRHNLITVRLPRCSLSQARNKLLSKVTGNIIALADDDCIYPKELFSTIDAFFTTHPKCGCIICDWGRNAHKKLPEKQISRYRLIQRAPSIRLFFRREAIRYVGFFDETMGVGAQTPWQSGEDTDMLLRVFDAGYEIWRIPTPPIKHPDPIVYSDISSEKLRGYGLGRMYVLEKHSFPFWFKLINIVHPLFLIVSDVSSAIRHIFLHRWGSFIARLSFFKIL